MRTTLTLDDDLLGPVRVTWVMSGPTPFVSKPVQVFVSLDRVIGKDFEQGLANLKSLAEKS